MTPIIAWLLASPIGKAFVAAAVEAAVAELTTAIEGVQKQNEDLQSIIDQMKKDMERMRSVTPTTPIADQEKAADDVLRHF